MASAEEMMRANRRHWDARTTVHAQSAFYDLAGLRQGRERLAPFEYEELGPLCGRTLIHLQCHLGTDTICLARSGAHATGLDISARSVAAAARLADECGLDIRYLEANVYDAITAVERKRFDVVYTGKGALVWLPDLARWAHVVAELLRPGGLLYLVEFHPLFCALASAQPKHGLLIDGDCLAGRGPERLDSPFTYTDGEPLTEHTVSFQWPHGIGDVIACLLGAGFRLDSFVEHDIGPWRRFDGMTEAGDGWWRLESARPRLPVTYSLRVVKS